MVFTYSLPFPLTGSWRVNCSQLPARPWYTLLKESLFLSVFTISPIIQDSLTVPLLLSFKNKDPTDDEPIQIIFKAGNSFSAIFF